MFVNALNKNEIGEKKFENLDDIRTYSYLSDMMTCRFSSTTVVNRFERIIYPDDSSCIQREEKYEKEDDEFISQQRRTCEMQLK